MERMISRLRGFWDQQVHLHQLYLDRNDVSGGDAIRATRTLRWSGNELVGDLLPGSRRPS